MSKKQFPNYIVNVYEPKKVSEQMDLLSLYDEQKIKLEQISLQINELQSSLDDIVFLIYQIPQNISDMIKQNIQIEL